MSELERLYTVAEVAARLAVSRNLAYQLIASGSIPCIRLSGSRVIRVTLVECRLPVRYRALQIPQLDHHLLPGPSVDDYPLACTDHRVRDTDARIISRSHISEIT